MTSRRVSGGLAAAVALSLLWLLSGISEAIPFVPAAAAEIVVRASPGDVATFFIERLGHWGLRLLTLGSLVVAVAAGAEGFHRLGAWPTAAVATVVSGIVTVVAPSEMSMLLGLLGIAASGAAFAVVAQALHRPQPGTMAATDEASVDEDRRRMLRLGFGGAVGLAAGGALAGWVARKLGGPDTDVAIAAPVAPATIPPRAPWPEIPGLAPEVTSVADHYVVDINLVQPSVEAADWTLEVSGEVTDPLGLSFTDLQSRFDIVEEHSVLCCVSNEVGGDLIGNSRWGGVRLSDVLDAAGPTIERGDIVFRAADGYSDSIPLELGRDPSVLLAITQNGQPLEREHGFPCRVRIPAIYGMKNVKWVQSIEIVRANYVGYWQKRGWSDVATVVTQSRIDVVEPPELGRASWIAGVAWAGERGISKVEVSTDGGSTWEQARLREPISRYSWTQWALEWEPSERGLRRIVVRATDGDGRVQEETRRPPHPAGATGWHSMDTSVA